MTVTSPGLAEWLRPVLSSGEHADQLACGKIFERGGLLVRRGRRLSQLVHRRPPGVTTHQWNSALRTRLDYVACDPRSYLPQFAVEFADGDAGSERAVRMTRAVCAATGLRLLRVESSVLRLGSYGRRIVEYVIDAWAYLMAVGRGRTGPYDSLDHGGDPPTDELPSYRTIVGRLPDGRRGFVNDLGAVARAAAMEAYANRQLADPLVRGLHACWRHGPAEGWGWVEVRDGRYLFERVRVWQHGFTCGVEPGQLAEDLAIAAIGERLKTLDPTEPALPDRTHLRQALEQLRLRRDELAPGLAYDHVTF